MRALIGQELMRRLPPAPCDVRDTKLVGFVLRVRASGRHSYYATWLAPRAASTGAPGASARRGRVRWKLLGAADALAPHEAREEARKVLADVWKGNDPVAEQKALRSRIRFDRFIAEHYEPWAVAQRKTGGEQAARLRTAFGASFDALALEEITAFHVERWRSGRLKDGRRASTVNRDLNTLRGALSRAVEWGLLASHPLAKVKPSLVDRAGLVRFLSPQEELALRSALEARDARRRAERDRANAWRRRRGYAEWPAYSSVTHHLTPVVVLALNTGLRRGELFGLRWRDVDLKRAIVTVRGEGAKSGQTRHVPLNSQAVSVLEEWHELRRPQSVAAVVFAGRDGEPLDDIKTAWSAVLVATGIKQFRFHDLRHTFASKLVMAGVDLNTVRELLGHSDLKMTLRYAHLAPEHKAAAVAKLVAG